MNVNDWTKERSLCLQGMGKEPSRINRDATGSVPGLDLLHDLHVLHGKFSPLMFAFLCVLRVFAVNAFAFDFDFSFSVVSVSSVVNTFDFDFLCALGVLREAGSGLTLPLLPRDLFGINFFSMTFMYFIVIAFECIFPRVPRVPRG